MYLTYIFNIFIFNCIVQIPVCMLESSVRNELPRLSLVEILAPRLKGTPQMNGQTRHAKKKKKKNLVTWLSEYNHFFKFRGYHI